MKFVSILDKDLVLENLSGTDRESLYGEMLRRFAEYTELDLNVPELLKRIVEREDNTPMAYDGVALPHLRCAELQDLFIVVGLPRTPVKLKDNDYNPCGVIFLSLISDNTSDVYLKAVAALAKHIAVPANLHTLLEAARGGGDALLAYLSSRDIRMKKILTAEDVMTPTPEPLHADDALAAALDRFNVSHAMELPVVDAAGRLTGKLSALEMVKSFIPDYIFMMENLNFLNNFEVFNRIFHSEYKEPVGRCMQPVAESVTPETPLIQITVRLARHEAGLLYVTDADGRLLGQVGIDNLIHKVLRG